MHLITAILRGFQIIFAIIILSISVDLARGQFTDLAPVPAATGYVAFCGALGIVAAVVGIVSLCVDSLEGTTTLVLDGLSGLASLAGAISYAVILRETDCSNSATTYDNQLLSGGCGTANKVQLCYYYYLDDLDKLRSRCVFAKADNAFLFIYFVVCLGMIGYSLLSRGKSRTGSYA